MRPGRSASRNADAANSRRMGDFDPVKMFSALSDSGVDFLLIGGMAAVLHGDVGVTFDVDIVPAHDADNLERLVIALRALEARIRAPDVPSGSAFDPSPEFFRNLPKDAILNLTTPTGDLDLAFRPSGTSGYDDLKQDAVRIEAAAGVHILAASLADIIRSKDAANREKDRTALPRLRRLHEKSYRTHGENSR